MNRREFLQAASVAAANTKLAAASQRVIVVIDPADRIATSAPARWAATQLERALTARGVAVERSDSVPESSQRSIVVAGKPGEHPEALGLFQEKQKLTAWGGSARGLTYSLLELTDRVQHATDPLAVLQQPRPLQERPTNQVRSVTRMFTSDVEDKPWFNDREMWPAYFDMLASQRFNRFHLALGIGYDFIRQVTDAYFLFSYPFLLEVPGYSVRVPQLPAAERDRNLEMLKFISEQAAARGMDFQLGLWMHGYEWIDSPNPNYTIEGLTAATHGPYCRDAVRLLLQTCPAISGVTFRVHGESGVEEGSYQFWKTLFDGVAKCGRKVEIDMHAKGMDQTMIDMAVATGQPVRISPKFWAEHLGMTYHQADIREVEQPKPGRQTTGLMKFSAGSRSFLRYGYGDLLREHRNFSVIHRIWPGTQRLLLWGDPVSAAAYSRAFTFAGSDGVDICEPLSFKGRRGSGIAGDRCGYADASLRPRWDWQKYVYGHRVWGRLLFNPETAAEVWQRPLRQNFGAGAADLETALAKASRILPIVTTAHLPSAANNNYWPEMYLNQSMLDAAHPAPYTDTPSPKVFGNVSPLDPQLFSRINDFADDLLSGKRSAKYSPVEVAVWIEDYASAAFAALAQADRRASGKAGPEYRRMVIDVGMQAGLGRFFAAKFRSGVLYRMYEQTGDGSALLECLAQYRKAREAWASLANLAKNVYVRDVTVGEHPQLRGHWLDRLPAMDRDIALLASAKHGPADARVAAAIQEALGRPRRMSRECSHRPATKFQAGRPLNLELSVSGDTTQALLHYRHVTQAERYVTLPMELQDRTYRAVIPGDYLTGEFPLVYYFELKNSNRTAWLHPGLGPDLTDQPYFLVRLS